MGRRKMTNISPAAIKKGYFPSEGTLIKPNGIIPILVGDELVGYKIECGSRAYIATKRRMIKELLPYQLRVLRENPYSDIHIVFDGMKYLSQLPTGSLYPPIVNVMIEERDVELISRKTGAPVIDQSEFYTL